MSATVQCRIQPLGRGTSFGGIFATLLIHASLGSLVYFAHIKSPSPVLAPGLLPVTEIVFYGKKHEESWLPRIVRPPRPQAPALELTDDLNAPPTPKEAPKSPNAEFSKAARNALQKANTLGKMLPEEQPEGSQLGSPLGRFSEGQAGNVWATQVDAAIRTVWVTPMGLITEAELQGLSAKVRITIGEDGKLSNPVVMQSSGNQYFDDSIVQAVKMAGMVPPPPPGMKHVLLLFAGKTLAK